MCEFAKEAQQVSCEFGVTHMWSWQSWNEGRVFALRVCTAHLFAAVDDRHVKLLVSDSKGRHPALVSLQRLPQTRTKHPAEWRQVDSSTFMVCTRLENSLLITWNSIFLRGVFSGVFTGKWNWNYRLKACTTCAKQTEKWANICHAARRR